MPGHQVHQPSMKARGALLMVALIPAVALPIVMRHDVAEPRFLELARKYPAAVTVRPANESKGFGAEGTLVGSRWVLTAAHVASEVAPGDVVEARDKRYSIAQIFIHPKWKAISDLGFDIAVVKLSADVRDVTPVALFEGREPVGSVVTFVGRGGFGNGLAGLRGENRRLRAATNRIDAVTDRDLQFRFDRPGDP